MFSVNYKTNPLSLSSASVTEALTNENKQNLLKNINRVVCLNLDVNAESISIDKIASFPDGAEKLFLNMLNEMEKKGIYHANLKPENVLYHAKENKFYPINFSNLTENPRESKIRDKTYQYRINAILDIISNNTVELSNIDEEPLLGKIVGSGGYGSVYLARDNADFVFKKFFDKNNYVIAQAKSEASNFNRFYGTGAAEVLIFKHNVYIKMLKVPGTPLEDISKGELPKEAELAFYDLLSSMAEAKIMHDDLHEGNILYDLESNKFYIIDIGNQYYTYFNADDLMKDGFNFMEQRRYEEVLASIKSISRASTPIVADSTGFVR